jgi:hypothetical protein
MILLKQLTPFILALSITISATAQKLQTLIPKDAAFAGMIDIRQIKTKADFEELIKLSIVKKMDKDIAGKLSKEIVKSGTENHLDLRKYGINIENQAWLYFSVSDKIYSGALLLPISDKNKFTEFVKLLTKDLQGENIKSSANYMQAFNHDLHIVWNNNVAALFSATVSEAQKKKIETNLNKQHGQEEVTEEVVEEAVEESPIDDYPNNSYIDIYELKYAAIDSIKNVWFKQNTAGILQSKGTNSFAGNSEFNAYLKSKPDAAFVLDYGSLKGITNSSLSSLSKWYGDALPFDFVNSFTDGMRMYAKIDFKQDVVELNYDMKYSDKVSEIFNKVKKKKISKNFLKYMSKDLMGYYAVGIDVEGYSEGVKSLLKKNLPEIPVYGETAISTIDILDIIIDEKAIYDLFTGDIVLAINGFKNMEVIHKTYDYDDEFNRIEIIDTSMQEMPEVLYMMGIGNQKDVNKIIRVLVNTKVVKQEGNIYIVDTKEVKLPVYFSISDGILFVSNNKDYVKKPTIYTTQNQLGREHAKLFKKNTFVAYGDISGIADYFSKEGLKSKKDILIETSKKFQDLKISGKQKGKYMYSDYVLQLSETENNSIADILKFMDFIFAH